MPCIEYVPKRFGDVALAVIDRANGILADYGAQGFVLTLRQLYYQFVARDWLPNTQRSYSRLGAIINDARLAGLVDWDCLEDRTRNLEKMAHWAGPASIVRDCAKQFRLDRWAGQPYRPEVWIEKDALTGVIEGVCEEYDVPYFSCRGYTSQSEMWRAAMRLGAYAFDGQTPFVIHLGDHDPSGVDMSRDIRDRLALFGAQADFKRIALNQVQIDEYKPPPNPTKITDSRAAVYIAAFGDDSWELDALEPQVIISLIRAELDGILDRDEWNETIEREQDMIRLLQEQADEMS